MRNIRTITIAVSAMPMLLIPSHGKSHEKDIKSDKPYNILFFFADDMRPTIGAYGDPYAVTPNLDALADTGTLFSNAYCQQALSNPSRASLLTGLRPDQTGANRLETHFRDSLSDIVTLPQLFRENGYYTVSIGKVFHLARGMGDEISWDEPESNYSNRIYALDNNKGKREGEKGSSCESTDVPDDAYPDGQITNNAVEYLRKIKNMGDKPFFLAIGFMRPHMPFIAPSRYWDLYKDTKFEVEFPSRPEGSPEIAFHNNQEVHGYKDVDKKKPISKEKEQELVRGYYASVSYVDTQIGKIMAAMHELGLAENTIVVFWGDHGYHLGEQNLWCKSTNFEKAARVPLIISVPGEKGQSTDGIVEAVDVYPTLADLCGLETRELAGRTLRPFIEKNGYNWDYSAFNQILRPYGAILDVLVSHIGYSVRTTKWRCTCWFDLASGKIESTELYRMDKESIEKQNLSGMKKYRKIESELVETLKNYKNGIYEKNIR